jgi:hypothetical protein
MVAPVYNFSGRDFTAEFERMLALLIDPVEGIPEYTDLNHSDAGVTQIRLTSKSTDEANFYVDEAFKAGFVSYAEFKQHLIDLGLLVGFLPKIWSAASTKLKFTRREGVTGLVTIPRYTQFTRRGDSLVYVTTDEVAIQASADSVECYGIQGEPQERTVQPEDFILTYDWSGHTRTNLGTGVAAGTVTVSQGNPPQFWTEAESFYESGPMDRHFILELNGDTDEVWLVLGDGAKGIAIPEEPLTVSFVLTAGASGNCGHSIITGVPETLTDLITCTNTEPATGGAAPESIESIRRNIPRMTETQRRMIVKDDYEARIEHLPGVLHCQALDRNDLSREAILALYGSESGGWPHHYVTLVCVPEGGGPMSTYLKEQIWAECGRKGHLGTWKERYILHDAIPNVVNITARVGVRQGYAPAAVTSAVSAALQTVLAPQNRTIGGGLPFIELHQAASAVAGVSWVEFDTPRESVPGIDGFLVTPGTIIVTPA